ncbi:hypothetical protein [Antrihabitans cavernicola]|uniref:Uncharacterized protein n=1 Tax=Antrihabitans cavernicola TaxID=2495913 RepID=A0A5A7S9D7_9NOCA|nr:hypothetical protein [Spelaeibacter cavernicola]KAA0022516.1 hypothetical protein FOY51_12495 [Spelaeibacter cavernicola]
MAVGADAAVSGMRSAIDGGTLRLKKGTAADCAKRCDAMAAGILDQVKTLQRGSILAGFGGFETSAQLQSGFEKKAADAIAHLKEYAAVATRMAENFRAIESGYAAQEGDNVTEIGAAGNTLPSGGR